ncbi:MAG: hypothetical protein QF476_06795 [Dehalococcoidia bacterium]|nr:hypothetical protein [Dehalococcoidia bacterium]
MPLVEVEIDLATLDSRLFTIKVEQQSFSKESRALEPIPWTRRVTVSTLAINSIGINGLVM